MPAVIRLGLAGSLPGEPSVKESLDHIEAFASRGLASVFFEVVAGDLYEFRYQDGTTQVTPVKRDQLLPTWDRYRWCGEYTYESWYEAMMAAWTSRPGGGITCDEWSKFDMSVFLPLYDGQPKWVKLAPLDHSLGVCGVEYGRSLAAELGLPRHFSKAIDVGSEFMFLSRISA